jgi:hypothetical protein
VETYESDATINNSISVTVAGGPSTGNDFGFHAYLGSLSGTICVGDGDGDCTSGEAALSSSVAVQLTYAGTDGILGTADDQGFTSLTDGSSNFQFSNLAPGLYQVTKTNPANANSVADIDGGNPNNISVQLDFGPDGIPGNADDKTIVINRDFEVQSTTAVTLNSMTARAEAGTPAALIIFIVMGVGAALLIVWARQHRLA